MRSIIMTVIIIHYILISIIYEEFFRGKKQAFESTAFAYNVKYTPFSIQNQTAPGWLANPILLIYVIYFYLMLNQDCYLDDFSLDNR